MCTRRDFIRLTIGGAAGLSVPWAWAQDPKRTAKSVILLWMQGAPSQLDTFDPKPGVETGGPFKAIDTNVRGVQLSQHFTRLSKRMDKISLIRTVHSKDPNHDTAKYLLHTAHRREATVDYPHVGSLLSHELGTQAAGLPGCVTIGGDPGAGCGYLKPEMSPFIVEKIDDPLEDIAMPPGVNRWRLEDREELMRAQTKRFADRHGDPAVEHYAKSYERALALIRSEHVGAFDVSKEPEKVRKSYGDTGFGRACLMARRLVEAGVRFVEVQLGDWDTHADNFNRVQGLIAQLDPAFAGLVDDLSARRMLDETLVICMGEFGRTPKVNGANGRDHFTRAWSVALAGGGVKGGRVVGRTDKLGAEVVERPVTVGDLYSTIYGCMGIDTKKEYKTDNGRPIKILEEGTPVRELL